MFIRTFSSLYDILRISLIFSFSRISKEILVWIETIAAHTKRSGSHFRRDGGVDSKVVSCALSGMIYAD